MIIDLTLDLDNSTPVTSYSQKPDFKQASTIEKQGYNEKRICFNSHFGTHIDAPAHMIKGGKTLSDFPIETFVGECIVLDARDQNPIDIDVSGVKQGDIVFFYTNHIKNLNTEEYFKESSPVLSEALAQKLVEKKIRIVGLDSWTPDHKPYKLHDLFLGNDIMIVENLTNLDKIVGKRCTCYVLPLKVKDADGAPCRIIAQI